MADTGSPKKPTSKKGRAAASATWSDEERAAMRERARETRKGASKDGTADVLAKIAELPEADRSLATRVHELVLAAAPGLAPRTWYGMPAYARDGKVVCFFQAAQKFRSRYSTLGFSDQAKLDEGSFWPTSYAVTKLTKADEKAITALVKRATRG
jgi:uncharacterized protein YdhG (YjbR/CyaY superfamily)